MQQNSAGGPFLALPCGMLPRVWGFVQRVLAPPAGAANSRWQDEAADESLPSPTSGYAPPSPSRQGTPRRPVSPYRAMPPTRPSNPPSSSSSSTVSQVPLELLIQQRRGFLPPLSTPNPSTPHSLSAALKEATERPALVTNSLQSVYLSKPPSEPAANGWRPTSAVRLLPPASKEPTSVVEVLDSDEEICVKKEKPERNLQQEYPALRTAAQIAKEKVTEKERAQALLTAEDDEQEAARDESSEAGLPAPSAPKLKTVSTVAPTPVPVPAPVLAPAPTLVTPIPVAQEEDLPQIDSLVPKAHAPAGAAAAPPVMAIMEDLISEPDKGDAMEDVAQSDAMNGVDDSSQVAENKSVPAHSEREESAKEGASESLAPLAEQMVTPMAPAPRRKRLPRAAATPSVDPHELRMGPTEPKELNDVRLTKRRVITSPEQTYMATHSLPPSPLLFERPRRAKADATPKPATTPKARKPVAKPKAKPAAATPLPPPPAAAAIPASPAMSDDERSSTKLPEIDEWRRIEEAAIASAVADTPRPKRTPRPAKAAPSTGKAVKRRESPSMPKSAKKGKAAAKASASESSAPTPQRRRTGKMHN